MEECCLLIALLIARFSFVFRSFMSNFIDQIGDGLLSNKVVCIVIS